MNIELKQKGFSLLEVMIAVLILGIGLLGMAAMQAVALSSNQEAQFRLQALAIAEDLASRMRANTAYINLSVNDYTAITTANINTYNAYFETAAGVATDYNSGGAIPSTIAPIAFTATECGTAVADLSCRANVDVADIRRQLDPTGTTGLLLPAGSLVFVDCIDKLNTNYLDVADPDGDNCSPGSVYTIFVIWPTSAERTDAGQIDQTGTDGNINDRCGDRLDTANAAGDATLLREDAGCVIMDIVP
jgi:type IV pilus assembly protein PilV